MAKKTIGLVLASLALSLILAACGQASAPAGSSADYTALIEATRDQEDEQTPIVTSAADESYKAMFDTYDFSAGTMERYAISLSTSEATAYGVAIILPAADRADDVIQQLEGFVEAQQSAQENTRPDQYAIAREAQIKMADTGEVMLVMAENAADLMRGIEAGLAEDSSQSN